MDFQLRPGVEEELADSKENNSDKDAVPRDPKVAVICSVCKHSVG